MELEESKIMSNRVTPDPEFLPKEMDGNYQNAESTPAVDSSQLQQHYQMRNYGGK